MGDLLYHLNLKKIVKYTHLTSINEKRGKTLQNLPKYKIFHDPKISLYGKLFTFISEEYYIFWKYFIKH